jgi:hypothetical protein
MPPPVRLAPCVPHWLTLEREAEMQISDLIRNCAVFIGETTGDHFYAGGTGFVVSLTADELDFRYVVTAGHVVWPGRRGKAGPLPPIPKGKVSLRVNTKNSGARIIDSDRADWLFHSDKFIDLCALRLSENDHNPNNDLAITTLDIATISLITKQDNFDEWGIYRIFDRELYLGDEVFITGAFISHIGSRKNIPIIRIGNIAAMPEEPVHFLSPRKRAYLIETRSLGGISGSPVFLHLYPEGPRGDPITMGYAHAAPDGQLQDGTRLIMPYVLIGMVLGAIGNDHYAEDFAEEISEEVAESMLDHRELNSGISVVLPIKEIIEFLHMPVLIGERMEAVAARRRLVGYRK